MLTEDQLDTIEKAILMLRAWATAVVAEWSDEKEAAAAKQVAIDLSILKVDLMARPAYGPQERVYGPSPAVEALSAIKVRDMALGRPPLGDQATEDAKTLDDVMCPPEDTPETGETCDHGFEISRRGNTLCRACVGVCIHDHLHGNCSLGCLKTGPVYQFPVKVCSCRHSAQMGDDPAKVCKTCRLHSDWNDDQRRKVEALEEELRQARPHRARSGGEAAIKRLEKLLDAARYVGD